MKALSWQGLQVKVWEKYLHALLVHCYIHISVSQWCTTCWPHAACQYHMVCQKNVNIAQLRYQLYLFLINCFSEISGWIIPPEEPLVQVRVMCLLVTFYPPPPPNRDYFRQKLNYLIRERPFLGLWDFQLSILPTKETAAVFSSSNLHWHISVTISSWRNISIEPAGCQFSVSLYCKLWSCECSFCIVSFVTCNVQENCSAVI
jgi:hypothetical protein